MLSELVDLMQNAKLDEERISESADWIMAASDERERNRRWGVVEALAGIWATRVSHRVRQILADNEVAKERQG